MDIERAITEVRAAVARVDEAAEAVTAARQGLHRAALRALVAVDGDAERVEALVRQLYWDVPELPVRTIEAVVGSSAEVRRLAGPGPVIGDCDACGDQVRATSRTQLASGQSRCKPCEDRRRCQVPSWRTGGSGDLLPPDAPPGWDSLPPPGGPEFWDDLPPPDGREFWDDLPPLDAPPEWVDLDDVEPAG